MTTTDDEFGVTALPRYRRPGRGGRLLAPARWLRSTVVNTLANLELSLTETVFAALVTLIFMAMPIRFLWSTTPEFRGLVLTTASWGAGLGVAGLVAWKLAPAAWRYTRDRYDEYKD